VRKPTTAGPFEIVWVGDVLLASSARPHLEEHGYDWPFAHLGPLMDADYRIGNAEGPITECTDKHSPEQRWSYRSNPVAAAALARAGFDAMGMANNHAYDRGPVGLMDTIRHLRAAGVAPFGAGLAPEATAPLLIPTPFGQVGVVALGKAGEQSLDAGPEVPGTVTLSYPAVTLGRELALAAGARWVVAFVHWGRNYLPVSAGQREAAAALADMGYDLVIGTGAHIPQPVEVIGGIPVLFCLGNFTFGSKGRFTAAAPGFGLVARTSFDDSGLVGIELRVINTDNREVAFQPRPCDEATAAAVLSGLGPDVTVVGGTGVVSCASAGPSSEHGAQPLNGLGQVGHPVG
jgi:poly-gamma-glutamate capsule biosynthesis protein CapA/YwtB (metallophosphatase superfamily)